MTLNAAELQVPHGKLYQDGDKCQGKPGHVYVKHFAYAGATTGQLYNGQTQKCTKPGQTNCGQLPKLDPRNVPLQDQELLTIAFVPSDEASKVPPPPDYVNTNLKNAAASSTSTTTTPTTALPSSATTTPKTTTTTVKK
jgi:hypothetical protein